MLRKLFLCSLPLLFGACQLKADPRLLTVVGTELSNGQCLLLLGPPQNSRAYPSACSQQTQSEFEQFLATPPNAEATRLWLSKHGVGAVVEAFNLSSMLAQIWRADNGMQLDLLFVSPKDQAFAPASENFMFDQNRAAKLVALIRERIVHGDFAESSSAELGPLPNRNVTLWIGAWQNGQLQASGDGLENDWDLALNSALSELRQNYFRRHEKTPLTNAIASLRLEVNLFSRMSWSLLRDNEAIDRFFVLGKDSFYVHAALALLKPLATEVQPHQFLLPRSAFTLKRSHPAQIVGDLCHNVGQKRDCLKDERIQFDSFRAWNIVETASGVQLSAPGTPFTAPSD